MTWMGDTIYLNRVTFVMPKIFRKKLSKFVCAQNFLARTGVAVTGILALAGCANNPYPPGQSAHSVIYTTMADDPRTLDPTVSYTVNEGAVVDVIYPSFFKYHYLKRPFELELELGAETPRREPYAYTAVENGQAIGKMGERYTFRIKKGLRFQDDPCFPGGKGREIVARDFIYAFRRMADPSVNCPVVGFFQDKILGFDKYVAHNLKLQDEGKPADFKAPVKGLELDPNDPYTFRITLNQPYPQLRYLMAMHFTSPLAHEAVERYGEELARHPVGSGPFLMAEYLPKRRIVLRRNPNRMYETYPSEGEKGDKEAGLLNDAGHQLPQAEEVVFSIVKESITSWNLFQQGYLDSASVTPDNFNQVVAQSGNLSPEMAARGVKMRRSATANIQYFCFNMKDPVVGGYDEKHRKLRQAISLAINSREFINLFSQGLGKQAQFILPPGLFGYEESYQNPYRQYDPALKLAKQLLKEAGYPDGRDVKGERLTIYFDNSNTTPAGRQFNALVKRQIEALGIHLESRVSRGPVWQDRVSKGQFQFIKYGWYADYPDAENFVFLLYGPNRHPGPNHAAYDNPEYNRVFEQMRSMEDGPQRLALIRRLRTIATRDCPWIYINHDETLSLSYDWLTSVKLHPIANDYLKYRGVNGPRRAQLQATWNRPWLVPLWVALGIVGLAMWPATMTLRRRHHRPLRNPLEGALTPKTESRLQEVKH